MPTNNEQRSVCTSILGTLDAIDPRIVELERASLKLRLHADNRLESTPENDEEADQSIVDDVANLLAMVNAFNEVVPQSPSG